MGNDAYQRTKAYWLRFVRNLNIPLEWQEAVVRAAITLKMCSYDEVCLCISHQHVQTLLLLLYDPVRFILHRILIVLWKLSMNVKTCRHVELYWCVLHLHFCIAYDCLESGISWYVQDSESYDHIRKRIVASASCLCVVFVSSLWYHCGSLSPFISKSPSSCILIYGLKV